MTKPRRKKSNRYTDKAIEKFVDGTMNSDRTFIREPHYTEKLKDGFEMMSEDEIVRNGTDRDDENYQRNIRGK